MTRAVVAVALPLLICVACGPRPAVESATIASVHDGQARIAVALHNTAGEGQVEVLVTVRNSTGGVVGRTSETVSMRGREHVRLLVIVPVADSVELNAIAEARYPPS